MASTAGRCGATGNASLAQRTDRSRHLAEDWLVRQHASQALLASVLQVERTTLCRFLKRAVGFEPTPHRPALLRLVERIEERCRSWDLVRETPRPVPSANSLSDDDNVWFSNHTQRLRVLRNEIDPAEALGLVSELCAQAAYAPAPLRFAMATNTLLTLASRVATRGVEAASRQRLLQTAERILRMERVAMSEELPPHLQAFRHRPRGYAGVGLAFCRLHLGQLEQLGEGFSRLFEATAAPHDPLQDGHWPNLLRFLSRLFETDDALARSWSERAARLAAECADEPVLGSLSRREFPRGSVGRCGNVMRAA